MNILRYASDGDIKVNVEFDNTASSAENNVITVKQTLQEKFDKLLKKQAKAYEKVKKTVNESEEIRIKVMKELHDANIRITRKLLFMHELDLEEKRRRENKLALQNNAAGIIQGRWKEKQARNNKKRKKRRRKESKLIKNKSIWLYGSSSFPPPLFRVPEHGCALVFQVAKCLGFRCTFSGGRFLVWDCF